MTAASPDRAHTQEPETPEQWVKRVLKEHGPPPPRLIAHLRHLQRKHAQEATTRRPA